MVGAGRRSEPTGADATRPARECSRRPRRPQMPVSDTSTRARARRLARPPRASAWRWRYARERGYADTGGREGVPRTPRRADNPDDHRQAEHDRFRARQRRVRAHPRHGEPRGWRAGPYPMGSRRCQHAVRERENRHQHDRGDASQRVHCATSEAGPRDSMTTTSSSSTGTSTNWRLGVASGSSSSTRPCSWSRSAVA